MGPRGLNSDGRALRKAPFPAEPSLWPMPLSPKAFFERSTPLGPSPLNDVQKGLSISLHSVTLNVLYRDITPGCCEWHPIPVSAEVKNFKSELFWLMPALNIPQAKQRNTTQMMQKSSMWAGELAE